MAPRIRSLVIALRVSYLASLGFFLAAVVVAVTAAVTMVDTSGGGFEIIADVPDDSPANILINWIALASFVAAALGALFTVLARVVGDEDEQPEH